MTIRVAEQKYALFLVGMFMLDDMDSSVYCYPS